MSSKLRDAVLEMPSMRSATNPTSGTRADLKWMQRAGG